VISRFVRIALTGVLSFGMVSGAGSLAAQPARAAERTPDPSAVTLQFQGIDVVEVLKILAEQAGFNLVAGRNVSGKVTLFVKDVDPWEALEVILVANELAYNRRGKILTIMTRRDYEALYGEPFQDARILKSLTPQHVKVADLSRALSQIKTNIGRVIADESTNTLILMDNADTVKAMLKLAQDMDRPVETQIFSLNYGTVKDLTPLLEKTLTRGMGAMVADERTNKVVVTDYPERLAAVTRMVEAFDERTTQVLIEAKIFQVTLGDEFQLGINWELLARRNVTVQGLGALGLTQGLSLEVAKAALDSPGDYQFAIEALRTFGDTEIISEPRVLVANNQEAKFLVATRDPYITTSQSQSDNTVVTSESVSFIDVGVELFVTPTIAKDGFIQMKVAPKVSSKTGELLTSEGNKVPIVETAEAETILLLEDGGTVILGGLIQDTKAVVHKRIPFLGDIPLVGYLFRSSDEETEKTETVVFLTARTVSGYRGEFAPAERVPTLPAVAEPRHQEPIPPAAGRSVQSNRAVLQPASNIQPKRPVAEDGLD
jgi:type IV pilus assembly protein PilQ